MKNILISGLLALSCSVAGAQLWAGAKPAAPGARLALKQGWMIQSSAKVKETGRAISTPGFRPKGWYPASVPSTVFAALVKNKVYPNPDFGMNLRKVPGIAYPVGANFANLPMPADSPYNVPWWFRTEFKLPPSLKGQHIWLDFHGINYKANIWLNGRQIANASQVAGMWRQYELDATGTARPGKPNALALEIFAPTPDDLSITFVDWNPLPPDKDMGIYRGVYIRSSGPVAVRNVQVVTRFDLPSLEVAHLTLSADLRNLSSRAITGVLRARIEALGITLAKRVRLGAHESARVILTPQEFPKLDIPHPPLWWPYPLGPQNLERLSVEFGIGGKVSDRRSVEFGIREITSKLDAQDHRLFMINGKRILIRGGGWSPDMLLRPRPKYVDDEIRYVRDLHLNAIRLEGKLMGEHLFNLCDRYGILVLAGWCCCDHWERWKSWRPVDYQVAAASLRDQLRRLRNHACILTWLYGSDNPPPPDVEKMYLKILRQVRWPNPFLSSASAKPTTVTGITGVKMTGPYQYVAPSYWLLDHQRGGAFGFNTETSPGPAIPVMASLREMLPPDHLWPIDEVWDDHAGGGAFRNLDVFTRALDARYGPATGLQDYVEKAQLMAYEGERAMFEAYGRNKYTSTGVIQWMLNNAWPSMIWHLFDFYLRPGGGYFGTKKACEPLHVQYSYDDGSIAVVNSYYRAFSGYQVTAQVYNLDLTEKFSKKRRLDIPADSSNRVFVLPKLEGLTTTYFLRLRLEDGAGKTVSSNFYWLSTQPDVFDWNASTWYYTPLSSYADFKELKDLPRVKLDLAVRHGREGADELDSITLKNPTLHLAFFVHLRILRKSDGSEIAPVLWEDNDFELMPGETRSLTARYPPSELEGSRPAVAVGGWNVAPEQE
jgi:exo-1,4-beta-D-glucosaminidase